MAHKRVLAELSSKYGRPRPQTLGDYDKATAVSQAGTGHRPKNKRWVHAPPP